MNPSKLLDLAMDHHRAGRLEEAARLYGRILETQPGHVDALNLAGTIAYQRGDDARALDLLGQAIARAPRSPEPHYHLGLVLLRLGRAEEAATRFRQTLELAPKFARAHCQLGLVRQRQGRLEEAARCFQHALIHDPTLVDVPRRLAEVLLVLGRADEALPLFEQALAQAPSAALHCGLGDALHLLGQLPQAVTAYRQAVAVEPNLVRAWWGLGCAESAQNEHACAVASFQQVVQLAPGHGEAYHNLGKHLFELGQVDAAVDAFRQAAARLDDPELPLGMIATVIPGSGRASQSAILDARRTWATRYAPMSPMVDFRSPTADLKSRISKPKSKITIGYVSTFFQDPNWMKPVWGLVNHHDRERFDIHLFSDAPAATIEHGYVKDWGSRYHDVARLTNRQLAEAIVGQSIDILVDLNAYSRLSRLQVFALRPAPVIVAWFNMFATSGMDCFDYLIGDPHVFTAGEEAYYSEKVICVPGCYLTFEVTYPVPEVAPAPCLKRGAITFGCLAPQYKITTEVAEAFARILRGSPGSRLILKNRALASADNRRWVHNLFSQFGIAPERLELNGPAKHFEFLKQYADIDVALDTFPYNGGTTTMEALWQGVPVLTFNGDRWAGRISASLLHNAGLPEFVAPDLEGFVARAIELARAPDTPARLDELRRGMRDHLRKTSVCDCAAFARGMERTYRWLWDMNNKMVK